MRAVAVVVVFLAAVGGAASMLFATEASAKADAVDAPVPWCSDFRPGLDANVK